LKLAYLTSILRINITLRLYHVQFLFNVAIEKGGFDVYLPYLVIEISRNS
jgi:hypothetical protein